MYVRFGIEGWHAASVLPEVRHVLYAALHASSANRCRSAGENEIVVPNCEGGGPLSTFQPWETVEPCRNIAARSTAGQAQSLKNGPLSTDDPGSAHSDWGTRSP